MGESVTEGIVSRWLKAVGDSVSEGEALVEVTTDKVDVEVPAPATGELTEIVAAEGETVAVGAVLGRIAPGVVAKAATVPPAPPAVSANGSDSSPNVASEPAAAPPAAQSEAPVATQPTTPPAAAEP